MKYVMMVLLGFILSGCSEKLEKDATDAAAFQYGYLLAKTNASTMNEHSCDIKKFEHVKYKLISDGCKAYIAEHPELFIKGDLSIKDYSRRIQEQNEKDFELGYEFALNHALTTYESCQGLGGSSAEVKGCEQYVSEMSIPPEIDDFAESETDDDE